MADTPASAIDGVDVPDVWMGLDIRPSTRPLRVAIADADTVFWNGPMGVFEIEPFANGTRAVAEARGHPLPPSSAAATRPRRWRSSAWPTMSTTSPPAAALARAPGGQGRSPASGGTASEPARRFIAGNWKMNKTSRGRGARRPRRSASRRDGHRRSLAAVPWLPRCTTRRGSPSLGAQTMHWEEKGAFTGEVASPRMSPRPRRHGSSSATASAASTSARRTRRIKNKRAAALAT